MAREPEHGTVDRLFPGWSAPLVSGGVLAIGYLYVLVRRRGEFHLMWLAGATLMGFFIGCAVWLVDTGERGQVVARFLGLLSPLVAFLPLFGLPFTVAAVWANRTRPGHYRFAATSGFVLSVIISLVFLAALKFRVL